ncbi:MAG: SpoIID/LytB domain-containing protein [Candidatus Paceibacteria bacterium]
MYSIITKLKTKYHLWSLLILSFLLLLMPSVAEARPDLKITDPGYQAQYISQSISDPIEIEAGSSRTVTVSFKNTGAKAWGKSGHGFVSVYTVDPKYRDSKFSSSQWLSSNQPAKIKTITPPGDTGKIKLKLSAPQKTGNYKEKFFLASENNTWIEGGYFYLQIQVTPPSREPTKQEKKIKDPQLNVSDSSYRAQFISQSEPDPIKIKAGSSKKIDVTFQNNGSTTWYPNSSNYVSAYTVKPKYNDSEFSGSGWLRPEQPAKLQNAVRPGGRGTLSLNLNAPETTGTYVEHFHLAAENHTWIDDGYFYLKINVVSPEEYNEQTAQPQKTHEPKDQSEPRGESPQAEPDAEDSSDEPQQKVNSPYRGNDMFISKQKVTAEGGEKIKLILAAQNTGDETWNGFSLRLDGEVKNNFADDSWESKKVVLKNDRRVDEMGVVRKKIYFRAPPNSGTYDLSLNMMTDGRKISGAEFKLPVEVTSSAAPDYTPPFTQDRDYKWEQEPRIRVGLKDIENNYTLFTPVNDEYKIFKGKNTLVGTLDEGETVTLRREEGRYELRNNDFSVESEKYIRLEPEDSLHSKFELGHFDRRVDWKGSDNFDTYRGAFEYRLSDDGETLFAINDLLMEDYVKGIAETSNNPPMEMLKAQAVAARTYAQHTKKTNKHKERNFGVIAHTGDQLYLGVESEKVTPRYVQAAEATRGYMITYEGEIVTTPYFGHSNGYTSSWEQVWGERKPWLVSVRTEYDDGLSTNGHEVGMSQRDAAIRARKEDITWKELLKHYYTGVKIEKFYQ